MHKKNIIILLMILILFNTNRTYSQFNQSARLNYLFGVKIIASNSLKHSANRETSDKIFTYEWRLVVGMNATYNFIRDNNFNLVYPFSFNIALSQGSLGNDAFNPIFYSKNVTNLEFLLSLFNISFATLNRSAFPNYLYNLNSNFTYDYLQNQKYLFQTGSYLVFSRLNSVYHWQRIGYIQVRANTLQMGYYNDGPPFNRWFFGYSGDGKDRYYTGGGYIKVSLSDSIAKNKLYLSWEFDKYTGYMPDAFEIANFLADENIMIGNKNEQKKFSNRNSISLGLSNNYHNFEMYFSIKDISSDIQDFIHANISRNPLFTMKKYNSKLIGLRYNCYKYL